MSCEKQPSKAPKKSPQFDTAPKERVPLILPRAYYIKKLPLVNPRKFFAREAGQKFFDPSGFGVDKRKFFDVVITAKEKAKNKI